MNEFLNPNTPIGQRSLLITAPESNVIEEHEVMIFNAAPRDAPFSSSELELIAKPIEKFFNDGWQITEKIICPSVVILIFSRLKEIAEDVEKV